MMGEDSPKTSEALHRLGSFMVTATIVLLILLFSSSIYASLDPLYSHNITVRVEPATSFSAPKADAGVGYAEGNLGGALVSIIRREGMINYLSAAPETIAMNEKMPRNKFYLAFTFAGAEANIKERVAMMASGEFDKYANPSFGFPLSMERHAVLLRKYNGIDIESSGALKLSPGMYNLIIKNEKYPDGTLRVSITRE